MVSGGINTMMEHIRKMIGKKQVDIGTILMRADGWLLVGKKLMEIGTILINMEKVVKDK